jgi:hypothetical protein
MNSTIATRRNQRANPIARQPGSIDVNTKIDSKYLSKSKHSGHAQMGGTTDLYKNTDVPDTVYDVTEGEILMAVKKGQSRYRGKTNLCFSSANGLPKDPAYIDELVFAGMAVTAYSNENDKPREEQGFVATYAGLVTTMNTGSEPIYPGDLVRVTMPPEKGQVAKRACPKEKRVFGLAPVTKADMADVKADEGISALVDAVAGLNAASTADERARAANEIKNATNLVEAVVRKMQLLRRFEIGRALGHAVRGQTLDICLG